MATQFTPTINHISAIVKLDNFPNSLDFIEYLGKTVINGLELTVVKKIDHKFEPVGRTMVYILSESHLAIHTWPEFSVIHIDLVSCKNTYTSDFDRILSGALKELKVIDYRSESHRI